MRFSTFQAIAIAALLASSWSARAVTITVGGCSAGSEGLSTCAPGASVVTFNSGSMPAEFSNAGGSGGHVVSGSVSGQYAAPAGDSTAYLAVPNSTSTGAVSATLGGLYNYFGIYWGSIDQFNTLTFLDDGTQVGSFSGATVIADASLEGNQVDAGSNEYVNFYFGTQNFNTVLISSTNYAFESDNLAFGDSPRVPEPVSAGLLGLGLVGLAAANRRRRVAPVRGA
jgi:hypothetical protein